MEIFSAYEHETPILSSYTERKEEVKGKSPLITAQIDKSSPEHQYSKTIKWCSQTMSLVLIILRPLRSPYYIQARHVTSTCESRYFCLRDFKNTELKYQL